MDTNFALAIDFLSINERGEFVCMAQKRDFQITFRNNGTLLLDKRVELKQQIKLLACGTHCPYMLVYTS